MSHRYTTDTTLCGLPWAPAGRANTPTRRSTAGFHPDFLGELADDGLLRALVGVDPARDEAPLAVVDPADQQDPVVLVEDGRVGADLGRHVADVAGEALAHVGCVEPGAFRVLGGDERAAAVRNARGRTGRWRSADPVCATARTSSSSAKTSMT